MAKAFKIFVIMLIRMRVERLRNWVRPHQVVFEGLKSGDYKTDSRFKELFAVGLMTMGLDCSEEVFLESLSSREEAPDVKILGCQWNDILNEMNINYVEVVSWTEHADENCLGAFLERTKLNGVYDYQEETAILCLIEREMDYPHWQNLSERVSETMASNGRHSWPIFALNKVEGSAYQYRLVQLYPEIHPITFNAIMPTFHGRKKDQLTLRV